MLFLLGDSKGLVLESSLNCKKYLHICRRSVIGSTDSVPTFSFIFPRIDFDVVFQNCALSPNMMLQCATEVRTFKEDSHGNRKVSIKEVRFIVLSFNEGKLQIAVAMVSMH